MSAINLFSITVPVLLCGNHRISYTWHKYMRIVVWWWYILLPEFNQILTDPSVPYWIKGPVKYHGGTIHWNVFVVCCFIPHSCIPVMRWQPKNKQIWTGQTCDWYRNSTPHHSSEYPAINQVRAWPTDPSNHLSRPASVARDQFYTESHQEAIQM